LLVTFATAAANNQDLFLNFLRDFKKEYTSDELFYRFSVFSQNLAIINKHNSENHTWTMGINQFSDLTPIEFEKIYLGYIPRENIAEADAADEPVPPNADIDWTTKGAVTGVKNQGQCGSCWAFSTTGAIESAVQISHKTLTSLSEQQLVDCAGSAGNQGCNGGLMDSAFKWVISNGGIASESSYAYTARDGTCKKVASVTKITSYKAVGKTEASLLSA